MGLYVRSAITLPRTPPFRGRINIVMKSVFPIGARIHQVIICLAGIFMVAMMLLTSANIICRLLWMPIRGTFELMGFFGAIAAAFALGYTHMNNGHIAVDVLINRFSIRTRRILDGINNGIGFLFFVLLSWHLSQKALVLYHAQEVSETLRFPYYPFIMGVALGCLVLAAIMFRGLAKGFRKERSP